MHILRIALIAVAVAGLLVGCTEPPADTESATGKPAEPADPAIVASLAKAFQDSVIDVLVTKTVAAAQREGCAGIVLVGGVAANRPLRETLVEKSPLPVAIPPFRLCTDNGAMIAMSGLVNYRNGRRDDWDLDVIPSLRIGTSSLV